MGTLTVSTLLNAPLKTVWESWTDPGHIIHWNFASPDWHCPNAENELSVGGEFRFTMAARDGSVSFDFQGTYMHVVPGESLVYHIADGRKVIVLFTEEEDGVRITEVFEPEEVNSMEQQVAGWQSILENFRRYVEGEPMISKS
ncbi:MAG: hypothetical protein RL021_1240 [Bacteroidota bacterium]|jgi:uncharacterized protein YndB with AHSA1/START domain